MATGSNHGDAGHTVPARIATTIVTPPPEAQAVVPLMAVGASHLCIACGIEHGNCCGLCPKYRPFDEAG